MPHRLSLALTVTFSMIGCASCGGGHDGSNSSDAASAPARDGSAAGQTSKQTHSQSSSKKDGSKATLLGPRTPLDDQPLDPIHSLAYRPDCAPPPLTFTDASRWRVDYKPFSAWTNLAPWAFWGVEAARPTVLVELGSHNGYSTFAFAQAIQNLGLSTRAYAVDTWAGDVHAGFYDNDIYEAVEKRATQHYGQTLTLMRMTFDEALGHFADGSVDLLHIDGQHHYEDVKHDFETWLPKMSQRGVVYFHDIDVHERGFGVYQLWSEVTARYPHFSFHQPYGLGILGVGEDLPPAFVNLFRASGTPQGDCVDKIYKDLGLAAQEWEAPAG